MLAALLLPITVVATSGPGLAASCPAAAGTAVSAPCDSAFVPMRAKRLYDSREHRRLRADVPRTVKVAGRRDIPATGVVAAVLNVRAIKSTRPTYLTVWPSGQDRPTASAVHVGRGEKRAGLVVSALGPDGRVNVVTDAGRTDLVIDVSGYFVLPRSTGKLYHSVRPFRLYDSRDGDGRLRAGQSKRIELPSLGGVEPRRMRAALVNITAVRAGNSGKLTVHRAGTTRPKAPTLHYSAGEVVTNRAVTQLRKGALKVTNKGAATHVTIDVVGWFGSGRIPGGQAFTPLAPTRILDTRIGLGGPAGALPAGSPRSVEVAGASGPLPADAATALMTLTAARPTDRTSVRAWTSGATTPKVSDLRVPAGETTANLAAVRVGSDGQVTLAHRRGSADLVADLLGYFRPLPSPSPSTPPTTPPASPPGKSLTVGWGMSAPAGEWDQRVREVGPGLKARRVFLTSFDAGLSLPQEALADGLYPVISFKTGGYSWAQVAAGQADQKLRSLAARLDALPGKVFVAIHHEPAKDGPPADWAAMQEHALPILGAADNVEVGVIGNGWWWSAKSNGYTDAEIATYLTPGVLRVSDVIGADTYDGGPGDDGGDKIRRMSAWADRVGVSRLGIGEFNGTTAEAITSAMNAVKADQRFAWACVFNSNAGIGDVLTGDRLRAFQVGMSS